VGQGRSASLAGLPLGPAAQEVANRHSVKPISQVICFLAGRVDPELCGRYVGGRSAGGGGTGKSREGPAEVCEFRSAHRGGSGCQPTLRPICDRSQHRLEGSPSRSQSIAHAHRRPRIHEPLDDAFRLQLSQSLGENAVADARYPGKQLVETSGLWKQCFYDSPRPSLPDQLYRALKGSAVVETPSDHGERFYALSEVSESTRPRFSTRNISVRNFLVWDSGLPWT